MLKIYRYLATASAILLLAAMVLVAWLYNRQATSDLVYMTERYNIAVDTILSNTISAKYEEFFATTATMDAVTLRSRAEVAAINQAITTATNGLKILKVKIYNPNGLIVFSSDLDEIGNDYTHSGAFRAAAENGMTSSKLSYENRLSAFSGELFDRDVVETYVPRFDASGAVTTVFEVYSDVTDVKARIDTSTVRLVVGLAVIFSVVYAVLVVGIMRRAIQPIQLASKRAAEIGPDASGVRLPTEGMPREILPLVRAINAALARLDRALDAQRRFTADAAHELLTPIAVLKARVGDIQDPAVAGPLRQDIDAMTDMVHQLLYLSELEAAGEAATNEETDLHAAAVGVISLLAPLAIRDRKELALTGAAGPVSVRGSANMVNRVLRNLIENALRHTPAGTTVEIEIDAAGMFRVSDQGPGVPPAAREEIFERFRRGDKRSESGSGLGLAIVKRIVDAVGGKVWVEDAPGGGACFVVQLPLAGPAAEAPTGGP
ncbi:MAG TPA: HAMP domain-containing sensor histidine kinase [Thermohalobaculum sp.]|nr:HAMP domain-containing sensor histidine kinase [Thermohalobaculum sp.]